MLTSSDRVGSAAAVVVVVVVLLVLVVVGLGIRGVGCYTWYKYQKTPICNFYISNPNLFYLLNNFIYPSSISIS